MAQTDRVADLPGQSSARGDLSRIVNASHLNTMGHVHGGILLHMADEAGALAVHRHIGPGEVITAGFDSFQFLSRVPPGCRLEAVGTVSGTGAKWVEARLELFAEQLDGSDRRLVGYGYAVYVATDEHGRPREVRPMAGSSAEAQARQALRRQRLEEARAAARSTVAVNPNQE